MSNISKACKSLVERPEPVRKLNYLFLTAGFVSFRGRNDTSEGLDKRFALEFYARWKFVMEMMPLLQAAKDAGEDARVVTVLAAGSGGKVNLEDPGLERTYNAWTVGSAAPKYNDLMVEVRGYLVRIHCAYFFERT